MTASPAAGTPASRLAAVSVATAATLRPSRGAAAQAAGQPTDAAEERRRRLRMIQRRIAKAGPPSEAEVARMIAEFQARGGRITLCPPAHAVAVNNGVGRDAARWTV